MSTPPTPPAATIEAVLGSGAAGSGRGPGLRAIAAVTFIFLASAGYFVFCSRSEVQQPRYETDRVLRGKLVVTVSATGTLEPTNQVDVGSELSGLVEKVLVDDNDRVTKGQLLAQLDISKLTDQIRRSMGALASAEAKVLQANATTREARANLERLRAVAELSGGKVPSKAEMETAEATLARALADASAARAGVSEARAALSSDQTNLVKASIRSPIDGVVLARQIEPGQTVAASFETPVLFTLAEDLSQMELQVAVDEADVGHVKESQTATFHVDAYPARTYPARIRRVGLGSQTIDHVVSYETLLTVENDDLSLRPGMTATAEIIVATRDDALLVSNSALRFSPPNAETDDAQGSRGIVGSLLPRPPIPVKKQPAPASDEPRVWVLREGEPVAVRVTPGVSDGRFTEIVAGDLAPDTEVVTDLLVSPR